MNKILPKTLSRYLAVQAAYNVIIGLDKEDVFNNFSSPDLQIFLDFENKIKNKNINKGYFLKIFNNFCEKKNSIDEMISSNLNGEWKIDRLPTVITAILSVAISEMILFPKISINIIVSE